MATRRQPLVPVARPAAPWAAPDTDTIVRTSERVQAALEELVFSAAFLTIPPRVNRHLELLRIRQSLDFHATFADELPRKDDRDRVLAYLQAHPAGIAGVVDADRGVIVHASTSIRRRAVSYAVIVGAISLGALVTFVLPQIGIWLGRADWPFDASRAPELLVTYVLVFVGALAHLAVQVLKQGRLDNAPTFTALEEWTLWLHVNELAILGSVLTLWIVFLGLMLTAGNVDWLTALAVGYSVDSVADAYLQRFAGAASTAVAALTSPQHA
jgi:hypothetical protein